MTYKGLDEYSVQFVGKTLSKSAGILTLGAAATFFCSYAKRFSGVNNRDFFIAQHIYVYEHVQQHPRLLQVIHN